MLVRTAQAGSLATQRDERGTFGDRLQDPGLYRAPIVVQVEAHRGGQALVHLDHLVQVLLAVSVVPDRLGGARLPARHVRLQRSDFGAQLPQQVQVRLRCHFSDSSMR
jgi:hypothetical protein